MKKNNFGLSISQKDIYFESLMNSNSPQFNIGGAIILTDTDYHSIVESHKKVINSNDIFRVKFDLSENEPTQYFAQNADDGIEFLDFREAETPDQEAIDFIQNIFYKPINLTDSKLHRSYLIQVEDKKFYYAGLMHHILIDGFGFGVWAHNVVKGLQNAAIIEGECWKGIVEKNIESIKSKQHIKAIDYWDKKVTGAFEEAVDVDKICKQSTRFIFEVDDELIAVMNTIKSTSGWSISQQLRAAFSVALSLRYDVDKLIVNEASHNRRTFNDKHKIGLFTGESPLFVDLSKLATFDEVVKQNMLAQKEKFKLKNIGQIEIRRIMREAGLHDNVSQFHFNYIKIDTLIDGNKNPVELIYFPHNHSQAPLKLNVWDQHNSKSIRLEIDCNNGAFSKVEIELFVKSLFDILFQVKENYQIPLSDINYMTSVENDMLSTIGNLQYDIDSDLSGNTITKKLFALAHEHPDDIALEYGTKFHTYSELWFKAKEFAALLEANGIKKGDRVAIETDKTDDHFVSLFGISVAGCAFVPIDPTLPLDRVESMLSSSKASKVITKSDVFKALLTDDLRLNYMVSTEVQTDAYYLKLRDESSVLYILYTSGTTGTPKGVLINDHNFMARLLTSAKKYELNKGKILQFNNLSFDLFIEEIYLTLSTVSSLVIPSEDCRDPEILVNTIENHNIDTVFLTTPYLNHFLVYLENNNIKKIDFLKLIIVCGDELKKNIAQLFIKNLGDKVRLINAYGPTEATVDSTYLVIDKNSSIGSRVPIGRPLPMSSIMICNKKGLASPFGVKGEILIGGECVGDYIEHPEDTGYMEAPEGLSCVSNKWYKTGDFGRWNSEGELIYLGRKDDQIKIGGYRTSLSEISSVISSIGGIKEFIVMYEKGTKTLACFLVSSLDNIGKEILTALPYYLQPNIFYLESLPKTSNGKVNRNALKEMIFNQEENEQEQLTKTELAVSLILKGVLGDANCDVNTPFYQMGGSSIHAVIFSKKIKKEYQISISLDKIFEMQTVRKISSYIDDIICVQVNDGNKPDDMAFSLTI